MVVDLTSAESSGTGATVGISGYSNLAPSSHLNFGQQSGNDAVLLVFSVEKYCYFLVHTETMLLTIVIPSSSLHLSLAKGRGPQSSTNSKSLGGWSSDTTQVDRPQNG